MSRLDILDNKPLYNSSIIDNYIKLINEKYSFINIDELLEYAGMTSYQVEDQGHWFTQKQINLFHKKILLLTENRDISREAGAFSASPNTLGVMRRYTLSLLGPIKVYEMLGKWSKKFTRSSEYKSKKISSKKMEITVTPHKGIKEEPFQCDNRRGYLEGISKIFENKPPKVTHTECLSKGDRYCRYIVTFPKSKSDLWLKTRRLLAVSLFITCITGFFYTPQNYDYFHLVTTFTILFLSVSWYTEFLFKKDLSNSLTKVRDSSEELIEQINVNYNHALLANETGKILSKQSDTDGILAKVVSVLKKRLDYSRVLILLANNDKDRLIPSAGFGHTNEQVTLLKQWPGFHLDAENSQGIFTTSFHEKKPFLINDFNKIKDKHSLRSIKFAKKMGIKSFLCCPIFFENEALGILAVDNVKSGRPLLQRDINLLMGVAQQIGVALHNVTLESKLRHVQKMDAIGTLARGIAHDFNNIMTAIISYADIAVFESINGQSIYKSVEKVKQASFRAQDLVKQILTFSREIEQDCKLLNLPDLIYESLDLLKATFPDNITIQVNVSDTCEPIQGDETHLYQVLMNLCINAIHSMSKSGGTLTINLKPRILTSADTELHPDLIPGEYLQLEIIDTGHGIKPEIMQRIFEPYFTTKEQGKGTGIGLAVVHGIIKKHSGAIMVESKTGEGTTFKILLPDSKIQKDLEIKANESLPRGSESILIVDDEKFFADLLMNMLEQLGYKTTVSTDSVTALAKFKLNPNQYDLIITDYSMPNLNGLDFYKKISEINQTIPVILCTGFSETVSREIAINAGVNDYFQKPVLMKDLADTIYKTLNEDEVKKYIF